VDDDGDVFGERAGEALLEEIGGARRLGRSGGSAADVEDALHARRARREHDHEGRPRRDHPAAPTNQGSRG
jgi:hypothetical protein